MRVRILTSAVLVRAHAACAALIVLATLATPVLTCASGMLMPQGMPMSGCEAASENRPQAVLTCCEYVAPNAPNIRASKTEPVVQVLAPVAIAPHPASTSLVPVFDLAENSYQPAGIDSSPPDCSRFSILLI